MVEHPGVEELTKTIADLRIRLATAELELSIAQRTVNDEESPAIGLFASGDRVRITNKVVRPAHYEGAWDDEARERERSAIVTHTVAARPKTPTQVWLSTDNGTSTWRAPKHLIKISDSRP
jgi:hypothetical protein